MNCWMGWMESTVVISWTVCCGFSSTATSRTSLSSWTGRPFWRGIWMKLVPPDFCQLSLTANIKDLGTIYKIDILCRYGLWMSCWSSYSITGCMCSSHTGMFKHVSLPNNLVQIDLASRTDTQWIVLYNVTLSPVICLPYSIVSTDKLNTTLLMQ